MGKISKRLIIDGFIEKAYKGLLLMVHSNIKIGKVKVFGHSKIDICLLINIIQYFNDYYDYLVNMDFCCLSEVRFAQM